VVNGVQVVVGGSQLQRPHSGGHAWALAQWALGMRRIADSVTFVDIGAQPESASPMGALLAAGDVAHEVRQAAGSPGAHDLGTPDLLLDIMGFIPPESVQPTLSVFVDIDPGYPQIWRELGLADLLRGHDRFVTIGENIGRPDCRMPDCGLDWITTPPPVVLDEWPATPAGRAFTSVCTWRNPYGTVDWDGSTCGSRVHEFRQFLELPRLVDAEFELALDIHSAEVEDLRALEANGWRLADPAAVAGTPNRYRSYIQASRAEFSVAQGMYVTTQNGWLSDRSLCYLASGKPVLAQDTGFSRNYPVGEGLIAFSTLEEAAAGVDTIERDYDRHSRAARELAEEYFDADKVLSRLLTRLGVHIEASA
jgi:hypothetical protein